MPRQKLNFDPGVIERMALVGNTIADMATILGCSRDTLEKRFSAEIEKGRAKCRQSLRELMWRAAVRGNITMQIFLSKQKQMLGYSDKVEQELKVENISKEEQNKRLEELHEQVRTMLLDQPQLQELKECQDGSNLPSLLGQTFSPSVSSMEPSKLK